MNRGENNSKKWQRSREILLKFFVIFKFFFQDFWDFWDFFSRFIFMIFLRFLRFLRLFFGIFEIFGIFFQIFKNLLEKCYKDFFRVICPSVWILKGIKTGRKKIISRSKRKQMIPKDLIVSDSTVCDLSPLVI